MWKIMLGVALVVVGLAGCSASVPSAPRPEEAEPQPPLTNTVAAHRTPTAPATPSIPGASLPATHPFHDAPREPTVFAPGVISTDAEEWGITFTPDGLSAYFARSEQFFPQSRQATIMETHWEDGRWSEPRVAAFSGEWSDIDPFISPDGTQLFFSSIRPVDGVERADINLWVVERAGEGWGDPIYLGDTVNSTADELYPAVTADGTLYFASDRRGGEGGWDIYRAVRDATGAYQAAENLGPPINTARWEFNPYISPDGTTLLFTALGRSATGALGGIYVTYLQDNVWSEPVGLGPLVNSSADEYHPRLSPQGDVLFFVRRTQQGDIYHVQWDAVRP